MTTAAHSLSKFFSLGALVTSVFVGCAPEPRTDLCNFEPDDWDLEKDLDGFVLRCERVPELCDLPVESWVRQPDLELAYDIVFVGDGYTADGLPIFQRRVDELIADLDADKTGIIARAPDLFNFHRVDLVSPGDDFESRPLRSCVTRQDGSESAFLTSGPLLADRVAANAPDADVIVVLVNGSNRSRNSAELTITETHITTMTHATEHGVLTHELAHMLVGLHDEYEDLEGVHPAVADYDRWTDNPLYPNLSLSEDERWEGLVDGSCEGGGRYESGVYRPTDSCRLLDSETKEFCPVCNHAVNQTLAGRRGIPNGPPRCVLAAGPGFQAGDATMTLFARDENGLARVTLQVGDGPISGIDPAAVQLVSEVAPIEFIIQTDAPATATVRVTCTDTQGEVSQAELPGRSAN